MPPVIQAVAVCGTGRRCRRRRRSVAWPRAAATQPSSASAALHPQRPRIAHMKLIRRNWWQSVATAVAAASLPRPRWPAGAAFAQKTRAPGLHGARDRPAQGLPGGLQQGESRHRDQVGARLHRRHHRQAPGREGEPAGRRRDGRGGVEPGACSTNEGMLQPYAPTGLDAISAQYRDAKNPPAWVGMDVWGATICFNTVEAAEAGPAEAGDLEGPDRSPSTRARS